MLDKGVPLPIVKWLASFLQNRLAKVRFNNELSDTRCVRQGLPQGSVLAPVLFIFYIDNLAELLPDETVNILFADDVGIKGAGPTIASAQEKVQKAVDIVTNWSKQWKLNLNATKSECSPRRNLTVNSTLDGTTGKDDSESNKQAAVENFINDTNPHMVIYTDGSASGGTSNGGAGIVIANNDPRNLVIKQTITVKGASLTFSYEEELQAMQYQQVNGFVTTVTDTNRFL